jgi:predicted component of type VI protein secretion system
MTKGKEAIENMNSNNNNSVVSSSNIKMEDVKVNLSIDITGTDKMNPEDLKILFETNQTLKQSIVANVQSALSNANGSNGSNPIEARKQMDKLSNIALKKMKHHQGP